MYNLLFDPALMAGTKLLILWQQTENCHQPAKVATLIGIHCRTTATKKTKRDTVWLQHHVHTLSFDIAAKWW